MKIINHTVKIIRKIILTISLSITSICAIAQVNGSFQYMNDGHIYFVLTNPTYYDIYGMWSATNNTTNEQIGNSFILRAGSSSYFGPSTIGWTWIKGEQFHITANGENTSWACQITDPSVKKGNPNFGASEASMYNGKKCGVRKSNGFYCDCSGCRSGNWDPFTCSKCGHKCKQHTR